QSAIHTPQSEREEAMPQYTAPEPFTINVPDAVLTDLRERLDRVRWPGEIPDSGWDYGTNLSYLKGLVEYWRTRADWRPHERQINRRHHSRVSSDGRGIYSIHDRGKGPKPVPLIIPHGGRGSFYEFMEIIGPLTDPAAHGGDPADAFDLVIPSLPGYGFSDAPRETGWNPDRVGRAWVELMARLGYERYGAQGGDWGSAVGRAAARHGGEPVLGIHLTHDYVDGPTIKRLGVEGAFERSVLERRDEFNRTGRGYSRQQSTRPQTLGFGLADSPAGQCAWIL